MISNNKNKVITFFMLFSSFAFLQEKKILDSIYFNDVILTATRTERRSETLPLPVQIITEKEIQNMNAIRLTDILTEQTGLVTVPDFGGGEGIQIQGLDSQFTLILIDGVPLIGRSAGTFDLNRLTTGNIRQIEIVKGPSSALYGNEALGGVINIITKDPKLGLNNDLRYRVGEFASNDLSLSSEYKKGKFGATIFANRYSMAGYDLDQALPNQTQESFENYTFQTKLIYDISEKTELKLLGRYYHEKNDLTPTENIFGENKINEWNVLFNGKHQFNKKWEGQLELYATNYHQNEFTSDGISEESVFQREIRQWFLRPEARVVYKHGSKSEFIAGVGITRETLERVDFSENPEFNAPYVYLQWDWHPIKKINIISGARFDSHNVYEPQLSPKLAVSYAFLKSLIFKGSVGFGYKAPDFRQLYFDFQNAAGGGYIVLGYNAVVPRIAELEVAGQINAIRVPLSEYEGELNAENSIGINLGFDYRPIKTFTLGVNFFRNDIQDLIDTRVIAQQVSGANVFSYYNVDEAYTQGLEVNANWKPNKQWRISAGYQLLYAKDKAAEDAFEQGIVFARDLITQEDFRLNESDYFGLPNRSRNTINLRIFYDYQPWGMNANVRGIYRSKFGLLDTNGNSYIDEFDEFVDGYTIWDFAINKTLFKNYQVGFGIDNTFNFTDPQNISNIAGRIVYGTVNIKF